MIYPVDNLVLIEDFLNNLHLFTLENEIIYSYYFKKGEKEAQKRKICKNVFKEYAAAINDKDGIYIFFQDKAYHLKLLVMEGGNIEKVRLTEEAMPEIFNLRMEVINNQPHIVYYVLLGDRKYRIVHHYYNGTDWITHIVEDIEIEQILNPIVLQKHGGDLQLIYNDKKTLEEIYYKNFNSKREKWENSIKLTEDPVGKLYLDSLIVGDYLHLVYCEYEGNLVVKYVRYKYDRDTIIKEIEMELSNRENISWPILLYYENSLWTIWIEYKNIISRFSLDNGKTWSPAYLWQGIKSQDIVRYKYITNKDNGNILNHSFGTIGKDINFVGFGSLDNAIEVPLKKKRKNYPQIPQ